ATVLACGKADAFAQESRRHHRLVDRARCKKALLRLGQQLGAGSRRQHIRGECPGVVSQLALLISECEIDGHACSPPSAKWLRSCRVPHPPNGSRSKVVVSDPCQSRQNMLRL